MWKELVWTRVTAWHERNLRFASLTNSKMSYLNVQLLGLSGKAHPTLHHITNTLEVRKFRSHMKLLTCDFGHDPLKPFLCHLCGNVPLTSQHLLMTCKHTSDVTQRMMPDLLNAIAQICPYSRLLKYIPLPGLLTQFLFDCTSFNLPNDIRISPENPNIFQIFHTSRNWCYAAMRAAGRRT